MNPAKLYDLLEEWALRAQAMEPLFRVPGEGSAVVFKEHPMEPGLRRVAGHKPLLEVYPRDVLDFLKSLT